MTSTPQVERITITLEDLRRAAVSVRRIAKGCQDDPTLDPACYIIEDATPAWGVAPIAAAHLYLRDEAEFELKECGFIEEEIQGMLELLKRYVEQESTMYFDHGQWNEMVHGTMVPVPDASLRLGPREEGGE